jgi:hypothetical protein
MELMKPVELDLRFYGRFIFVMPKDDHAPLTALAVNLQQTPTTERTGVKPPDCHEVFLTVRQENVGGGTPERRLMSTDYVPFRGALNVWNLEHYVLDVCSDDPFEWRDLKEPPVRLADLDKLSHCKLNPKYLGESPEDPVTAIIRIFGGSATPLHIPSRSVPNLIPDYEYVLPEDPNAEPVPAGKLADMVQVSMSLPSDGLKISMTKKTREQDQQDLTICGDFFELPPNPPKEATKASNPIVVVTFSNLCNRSEQLYSDPDIEFACFYNLLSGTTDERRVPKLANPKPPATTCGVISQMVPFGDCFLGAKISYPV